MDVNRAKEIIESPERFQVEMNGKQVWIDSVDATTQMATVHEEGDQPRESMTVRVQELTEVGKAATRM
ncbi:H-type small acid-soluble spore protein [Paenibacillus alkalitolerans]|uniref:H-type small acid-soluble spore protein n=1 Tax=Paenibacillus alkalitolerans TaxID=2799335 RepID=UPI0018F493E5|nr:H-type small acid-soluble spore protein [Paenibacillus alkalitolerans]